MLIFHLQMQFILKQKPMSVHILKNSSQYLNKKNKCIILHAALAKGKQLTENDNIIF